MVEPQVFSFSRFLLAFPLFFFFRLKDRLAPFIKNSWTVTSVSLASYELTISALSMLHSRRQRKWRMLSLPASFCSSLFLLSQAPCLFSILFFFSHSGRVENNYSVDEVYRMLDGLAAVVKSDAQKELQHITHSTCLLLRQMFAQAETIMLDLHINTAELQNE
jgi:hypothetical protein